MSKTTGNAKMEGDSRTHVEKPVFSSHWANSITVVFSSKVEIRGHLSWTFAGWTLSWSARG